MMASLIRDEEERKPKLKKWELPSDDELMEIRAAVDMTMESEKKRRTFNKGKWRGNNIQRNEDNKEWVPVCKYYHKIGHVEKSCRRRLGLCLKCGVRGHFANRCLKNKHSD